MAVKTIRRNPLSVDTKNLDEKYVNFMEYKGLCTNKDYVTVDQETFSEVNNMYVNQSNELSTRPPLKTEDILNLPSDRYKIADVIKINDKVFYKVYSYSEDKYTLACPKKDGSFLHIDTEENMYLMWFNYGYALFISNKIVLIIYGENDTISLYENSEAIYIPITKIIEGSTTIEYQNKNIFTDSYRERYLFEYGTNTPTYNIDNKAVTITIGDDVYVVTFVPYTNLLFYSNIGRLANVSLSTNDSWHYQVAIDSAGNNVYLASLNLANRHFISVDGLIWNEFSLYTPSSSDTHLILPKQYPVLSDSGNKVFCFVYDAKESDTEAPEAIIYYKNVDYQNIQEFDNEEWGIFDKIPVTDYSVGASHSKAIFVRLYNNSSEVRVTYRLVGYQGDYTSKITMTAFGSCVNDNVSYALSMSQGVYQNNNISLIGYYIGYLLFITDGTTNGNVFLYEGFNELIPDIDSSYACQNKLNKISVSWQGDIGFLMLSLFGKTYSNTNLHVTNLVTTYHTNGSKYVISGKYSFDKVTASSTTYSIPKFDIGISTNIGVPISMSMPSFKYYDILLKNSSIYYAYWSSGKIYYRTLKYTNVVKRYDDSIYDYDYSGNTDNRKKYQYSCNLNISTETFSSSAPYYKILVSDVSVFTDVYFYYNKYRLANLQKPVEPLYNGGVDLIWICPDDTGIYTNKYEGQVSVDITIAGKVNYLIPEHSIDFITSTFSYKNVLYSSSKDFQGVKIKDGKHLIYVPENTSKDNVFTDDITALINFSQTSLGIFLETCAYELSYDTSNNYYYLTKTKLQLGNRKGSDILPSYDGNSIFITTLKGLSALNYQDFVQSTEQVYNYLTQNIIKTYNNFATSPIKLCQYKDYLLLYKTNDSKLLVYDIRNSSWWVWTFVYIPEKIIYDGNDLLFLSEGIVYKFDFENESVYDKNVHPFDWSFTTQKLHFGAPNNYKHVKSLSIVTEQNNKSCRFKLKFINYRNLNNLSDQDVVEYEIDKLTTMIKKVNFIKTNAFQFKVSNDSTDKDPKPFITSNIAIKYRITERLR